MQDSLKLGIALYFRRHDKDFGLKALIENLPLELLPESFQVWYRDHRGRIEEDANRFGTRDIQFTFPGAPDYPSLFLKYLESPPLFMTYQGQPRWSEGCHLAVVGSRKISSLTQEWLDFELRQFLSVNGTASIVSGGARGVDQASHFSALRAHRKTYLFLPSGLQCLYPRDLDQWVNEIIENQGALLSEYWPTESMKKHYFIQRNRLIAAFSSGVLVAQGERRSGTMLTAQWAIDLGKPLGVIPGHPLDPAFSGNLNLLMAGAVPIRDHSDLCGLLPLSGNSSELRLFS